MEGLGSDHLRQYLDFQDGRYQGPSASFQMKVARWECFVESMALRQFQWSPKELFLCYQLAYLSFLLGYFLFHRLACLLSLSE